MDSIGMDLRRDAARFVRVMVGAVPLGIVTTGVVIDRFTLSGSLGLECAGAFLGR